MANGTGMYWYNDKETNINSPRIFQESPLEREKTETSEQKTNVFIFPSTQFFKTLETYYKNSICY